MRMNDSLKGTFLPESYTSSFRLKDYLHCFLSVISYIADTFHQHKAFLRVVILYHQIKLHFHLHLLDQVSIPYKNFALSGLSFTLCLSPLHAILLHTLSQSGSPQIPMRKYMCANQSDIETTSSHLTQTQKWLLDEIQCKKLESRPLGMRMKRV